jgi:hypothetical protein
LIGSAACARAQMRDSFSAIPSPPKTAQHTVSVCPFLPTLTPKGPLRARVRQPCMRVWFAIIAARAVCVPRLCALKGFCSRLRHTAVRGCVYTPLPFCCACASLCPSLAHVSFAFAFASLSWPLFPHIFLNYYTPKPSSSPLAESACAFVQVHRNPHTLFYRRTSYVFYTTSIVRCPVSFTSSLFLEGCVRRRPHMPLVPRQAVDNSGTAWLTRVGVCVH